MNWKVCWIFGGIMAVLLEIVYVRNAYILSTVILSMNSFPPSWVALVGQLVFGFVIGFGSGIVVNGVVFVVEKFRGS